MKKIFICLIGAIILSNCEISPKKAQAQDKVLNSSYNGGDIFYKEYNVDGMKYGVFYRDDYRTAPFVVNITRDKLQTEIITENLKRLKNGKPANSTE